MAKAEPKTLGGLTAELFDKSNAGEVRPVQRAASAKGSSDTRRFDFSAVACGESVWPTIRLVAASSFCRDEALFVVCLDGG